jgi:vitamin B12 transporter
VCSRRRRPCEARPARAAPALFATFLALLTNPLSVLAEDGGVALALDAGSLDASAVETIDATASSDAAELVTLDSTLSESQGSEAAGTVHSAADVTIRATASGAERVRASAQAVRVVELRRAQLHSADLGEVLARVEGVAIQRSGGLGSATRLSLHGLTDDQIRVFLDGVPLEMAGFGLGISTVPLAWIHRVDVHRGVLSPRYGADALGGALDLISPSPRGHGVAGSYLTGSFGTHQLALTGHTRPRAKGLLLRTGLFYDFSRNDYPVTVRDADASGRLTPMTVRRFHDDYRAVGAMVEGGFVGRSWARKLLLRAHATLFDKELQHDARMIRPYRGVGYGQSALGTSVRYELPRSPDRPFGIEVVLAYNHRQLDFQDRSRWVHNWRGERVSPERGTAGELAAFRSDLSQWEERGTARIGLNWTLSERHVLRIVLAPDIVGRTGRERLRLDPARIDPLTTRRRVFQLVNGLEYLAADVEELIENSLFVKQYFYRQSSDQVLTTRNAVVPFASEEQRVGAGDALRVRLSETLTAKTSYEYATRLPRADELFGDGVLVLPNLALAPETSHNLNLGGFYQTERGGPEGSFGAELGGFFRRAENLVALLLAQDRIHTYHRNVWSAQTTGVDGSVHWESAAGNFSLAANATYQDQRNTSSRGPFASFRGQRIPNRPWLFANASASATVFRFFARRGAVTLSWVTRYVHRFRPGWADTSATEDNAGIIPAQLTHALGAVCSFAGRATGVDLTVDVSNLTNEKVYDTLGVQRPGRAGFMKLAAHWKSRAAGKQE